MKLRKIALSLLLIVSMMVAMTSTAMAAAPIEVDTEQELRDAIATATEGEELVIDVVGDIELAKLVFFSKPNVKITIDSSNGSKIYNEGPKDNTNSIAFYIPPSTPGSTITFGSGLTVESTYCCLLTFDSHVITSATMICSGNFATIQGNGADSYGDNGDVTINGGKILQTSGGTAPAIYWPQDAKLTVNDGTIEGGMGIYAKSGEVTVNGGTIRAIGDKTTEAFTFNNSGSTYTGDAFVVENASDNNGSNYQEPRIAIKGGTFESENGKAVGSYVAADKFPDTEVVTEFISDGVFNTNPDASLIAPGENVVTDGENWYIGESIPTPTPAPTATPTTAPTATPAPAPKTGDNTNLVALSLLMAAAFIGIVVLSKKRAHN